MDSVGAVVAVGTSVAVAEGIGVAVGTSVAVATGMFVSVGGGTTVSVGNSVGGSVGSGATSVGVGVWVSAAWACAGDQPPVPKQRDKVNPANNIP
jgi:hypothetical protein